MASPPTQVITDTTTTPDRRDMSVADAHDLLERYKGNPYTVLLDVRTPQEYAAGRVAESLNVDYVAAGFRDEVNKLDRNKAYLVYCRTGIRSAAASDTMIGLGLEVYNMLGGIDAWQAAGYPVVQ
jgi:rhodanese-related sulfurtransferase